MAGRIQALKEGLESTGVLSPSELRLSGGDIPYDIIMRDGDGNEYATYACIQRSLVDAGMSAGDQIRQIVFRHYPATVDYNFRSLGEQEYQQLVERERARRLRQSARMLLRSYVSMQ